MRKPKTLPLTKALKASLFTTVAVGGVAGAEDLQLSDATPIILNSTNGDINALVARINASYLPTTNINNHRITNKIQEVEGQMATDRARLDNLDALVNGNGVDVVTGELDPNGLLGKVQKIQQDIQSNKGAIQNIENQLVNQQGVAGRADANALEALGQIDGVKADLIAYKSNNDERVGNLEEAIGDLETVIGGALDSINNDVNTLKNDVIETVGVVADEVEKNTQAISNLENELGKKADTVLLYDELNGVYGAINAEKIAREQAIDNAHIQINNTNARIGEEANRVNAELAKKADKTDLDTLTAETGKAIADLEVKTANEVMRLDRDIDQTLLAVAELTEITDQAITDLATETGKAIADLEVKTANEVMRLDRDIESLQDFANDTADAFQNVATDIALTNARIDGNEQAIESNKHAIDFNRQAIAENIQDIETVKADLENTTEQLAKDIGAVADQADANAQDIAKLDSTKADKTALEATNRQVESNKHAIDFNRQAIAENIQDIADNKQAIADLETETAKGLSSVADYATRYTNRQIADVNGKLADKADKAEFEKATEQLAKDIGAVADQADANAQDIAKLDSTKADKTALEATNRQVESNKHAIDFNRQAIAQNIQDIETNAENIARLDREKADQSALDDVDAKYGRYTHELYTKVGENIADIKKLDSTKADKTALEATNRQVESNKHAIDFNRQAIAQNIQDIETNAENIARLDREKADQSALDDVDAKYGRYTHELYTKVGENIADIKKLDSTKADKTALEATNRQVESNKHAIDFNRQAIAQNIQDIETNAQNIEANKQALSDYKVEADKTFATKVELGKKADASVVANLEKQYNDQQQTITAHDVAIKGNTQAIGNLNGRVGSLESKVNAIDKGYKSAMATQAALAGLFQPYTIGRGNLTGSIGGYGGQNAVAIGGGYRFDEKTAVKGGIAFNGEGTSYNIGVNFEF